MKTTMLGVAVAALALGCGDVAVMQSDTLHLEVPLVEGEVGAVLDVRASALSESGERVDLSGQVRWESSDESVAAFGGGGRLRFVAPGFATITAWYGDRAATATLTVRERSVSTLELVPGLDGLFAGQAQQLRVLAWRADGSVRDVTASAAWDFEGGLVAEGAAGRARATAAGPALARASLGGQVAERRLTIWPAPQVALRLEASSEALRLGQSARLQLFSDFADGSTRDVSEGASWSSSDEVVAQLGVAGAIVSVRARSPGVTFVVAVAGGVRRTVALVVQPKALVGVELDQESLRLPAGMEQVVTAFARYEDGERVRLDEGAVFSTPGAGVIRVEAGGRVKAIAPGAAPLHVTFGGMTATLEVEVTAAELVGLSASIPQLRLAPGQSAQLVVFGQLSDGARVDLTAGATVRASATVAAKAGGVIELQAQSKGTDGLLVSAKGREVLLPLEVVDTPVTGLSLTRTGDRVVATARWADGVELDVTELATWSIDGQDVATVSDVAGRRGELAFVGAGEAQVVAQLGDASAKLGISGP